ncbi:SRPBCC family protein [Streptomonospora nanhaiensis]|uniref:SRPBCC family protein n=1 Tax=Streptomonospora nanhaiensis TaxID=1323731 RepID=A0ABY6YR35_9ACTN|nr:SRPBCC family protein [Streptomonospora nanhaiensis]WAE74762.1 SRPBCC family protein [Streptomonospora nanhaiensis]
MGVAESEGPLARLRSAADRNEGTSKLADAVQDYVGAKASSVVTGAARKLGSTVGRLSGEGVAGAPVVGEVGRKLVQGKGPAKAVVTGGAKGLKNKAGKAFGKGGGGGRPSKSVNIVEDIDVGVPVRVAYNQWTRFPDFGSFAEGVQSVEKTGDTTSHWKGKVFWSSRSWKAAVTEQVQDHRIAWSTEAAKGTMKGAVTFHPLGENLTRVLLVVEYYPKGLFERTGNLWRAQGRRLRLDLKHYRRQVMMMALSEAEEMQGWRGEVREGEVVLSHEDALELEEAGLSEEQWDELARLDEDEAAELAELDPEERERLAELDPGPPHEEDPDDGDEPEGDEPRDEDSEELEEDPEETDGELLDEEDEEFEDEEPVDEEPADEDSDEADEQDLDDDEEYVDEDEPRADERS